MLNLHPLKPQASRLTAEERLTVLKSNAVAHPNTMVILSKSYERFNTISKAGGSPRLWLSAVGADASPEKGPREPPL